MKGHNTSSTVQGRRSCIRERGHNPQEFKNYGHKSSIREVGAQGLPELRGTHHPMSAPEGTGTHHSRIQGHMSFLSSQGGDGGIVPSMIKGKYPSEGIEVQSSKNVGAQSPRIQRHSTSIGEGGTRPPLFRGTSKGEEGMILSRIKGHKILRGTSLSIH